MTADLHGLRAQRVVACKLVFYLPASTAYTHLQTCSQAPFIRALSGHDKVIFPPKIGRLLKAISPRALFLSTLLLEHGIREPFYYDTV